MSVLSEASRMATLLARAVMADRAARDTHDERALARALRRYGLRTVRFPVRRETLRAFVQMAERAVPAQPGDQIGFVIRVGSQVVGWPAAMTGAAFLRANADLADWAISDVQMVIPEHWEPAQRAAEEAR